MNEEKHLSASIVFLLLMWGLVAGRIITVDIAGEAKFTSIQMAINDAANGDEIVVAPGTYNEAINFNGKAVRLYSSGGPDVTTINARQLYVSVVTCAAGEGTDTVLEGFTLTGGYALGTLGSPASWGGGMYNANSSPTVINCIFIYNSASGRGGGMANHYSHPTVIDCVFIYNMGDYHGGGMANDHSNPQVVNCSFINNDSLNGGGMYNENSTPTLVNCIFSRNFVEDTGGGMANNSSQPGIINCTFSDNTADWAGGAMWNLNSSPVIVNSILWGSAAPTDPHIHNMGSGSPNVTYSNIQGGTGQSWFGTGCIDADPLFINAGDDNLRLSSGSPCIDAGNNAAVPSHITTDRDGSPRIVNGNNHGTPTVDMGAYEYISSIYNITKHLSYVTIQGALDDADNGDEIVVPPGTYVELIDFLGKAVHLYSSGGPEVTIINGNGAGHVVQCRSGESASTIFEGFTVTGGWELWAGGMYNQNSDPTVINCIFSGNAAFYSGGGMYNVHSNPTVHHCVFNDNSVNNHGSGMYNSNSNPTVSYCIFVGNSTLNYGGGIYNSNSNPTITHCSFIENFAGFGGGVYNLNSNPTVTSCTFSHNTGGVNSQGGGMYNNSSSPTVKDCIFEKNSVRSGAGMYNEAGSHPTLINSIFSGNTAQLGGGGGIQNFNSNLTVNDCTFVANSGLVGGGMYNFKSHVLINNGVFKTNTAAETGGGIHNDQSTLTAFNGIFFDNSAVWGGGIANENDSKVAVINGTFSANTASDAGGGIYNNASNPAVTNSILWDNSPNQISNFSSSPTVTYSNVQGGQNMSWFGTGCIDADPLFVDAAGSDLRLSFGSPCIDAADSSAWETMPIFSFGHDGQSRFVDVPAISDSGVGPVTYLDMGAYEFQCNWTKGDINCDGVVNLQDLAILAVHWLESY